MEKFFCETKKVLMIFLILLGIGMVIVPISNAANVKVTGVKLNETTLTLYLNNGAKFDLNETVQPTKATNKKVTWSSSNNNIVTVDSKGKVTGKKVGEATITVKTEDGKKTAKCKVKVTDLVLNVKSATINIGETKQLRVISTLNNVERGVNWKSTNTKVATVNSKGLVTAKKAGTTIIKGTISGGIKVECKITVNAEKVQSVKLNKSTMSLKKGLSEKLIATIIPFDATNTQVTWSTSDKKVATVDSTGKVKAIKAGTATITVKTKDGGKTATCKVTVFEDQPTVQGIKVTGVKLNKTTLTLYLNQEPTYNLGQEVVIQPANATNKKVTWTSSNTKVVTVDKQTGKVKGVKVGEATITATTEDGKKKATCKVKVTNLVINKTSETIGLGETKQLKVVSTLNNINRTLKWETSNGQVAAVDSKGKVTGLTEGTATIRGTTKEGVVVECKVTVKKISVKKVKIAEKETMVQGKTKTLKATVEPSNASYKQIKWSSSNTKVATVDQNGNVKAIKDGTVIITARSVDGKVEGKCTIKIYPRVKSITIKEAVSIEKYDTKKLDITILPADAANKEVTWSSSNKNVVTVDQNGNITAKKKGTATITVKSKDTGVTAQCKVTVTTEYFTTFGSTEYKLAVKESKLKSVKDIINKKNIEQTTARDATDGLGGECGQVSTYYIQMLYGKVSNPTRSGALKAYNVYGHGVGLYSKTAIMKAVKEGKLVRIHLKNSSSEHWAAIVGYKVNGSGTEYDFLYLDPVDGQLRKHGVTTCKNLYNSKWEAKLYNK